MGSSALKSDRYKAQDWDDPERERLVRISNLLARALDTAVRIPGTSLTIGLDPLLGLVPGVGDALASLIGTAILGMAGRLGVPRILLLRMSLNLLINGIVGSVPFFGDLFSVWFRSHARNARLLAQAATNHSRSTTPDWGFVIAVIGGTGLLLLAAITGVIWLVAALWSTATAS